MNKSFREWFTEGESIYSDAMQQYQSLESQIEQLETAIADKRNELNQIALMLGKPAVEGSKRITAELLEQGHSPAGTIGSVTRALTGRGIVAR